jgi:ribonuclease HI
MNIEVYSDGSATTSDKPGGYGWVLILDGKKHSEGYGYAENATNNDMELQAGIEGLKAAHCLINNPPNEYMPGIFEESAPNNDVTLVSDSQLVLGWISGKYRFRQEDKIEKYKELQMFVKLMNVQTRWVAGHSGNEHNERCDALANAARLSSSFKTQLEPPKVPSIALEPDFMVYSKNVLLYVHHKGKIKEIDLEKNTVTEKTDVFSL